VGGREDYNPYVLQKIADETGGKFFEARSGSQLKRIYQEIDKLEKSEITADKYVKKRYFFQYPLFLGVLFLSIFIFLYRK
jgi:Ca-activated chloride channel family protein